MTWFDSRAIHEQRAINRYKRILVTRIGLESGYPGGQIQLGPDERRSVQTKAMALFKNS